MAKVQKGVAACDLHFCDIATPITAEIAFLGLPALSPTVLGEHSFAILLDDEQACYLLVTNVMSAFVLE